MEVPLHGGDIALSTKPEPPKAPESALDPVILETEEPQTLANEDNDAPPKKSLSFKIAVSMLLLVNVVGAMDGVIVASCLPAIAKDLDGSSGDTFWVGTGFLLAQTITIPIYGSLSDSESSDIYQFWRLLILRQSLAARPLSSPQSWCSFWEAFCVLRLRQ